MLPVLHFDPVRRPAGAIGTIPALGNHALWAELAGMAEQVRAYLALFEAGDKDAFRPSRQQPRQVVLAEMQRQFPQILAIQSQDIEGVEHYFVVMLPRVQSVEIGDAVNAEQNRLAIEDERGLPVSQCRLNDQRIAGGPIVAVAGEQPHARAVAVDDQAVAVVFYFMEPFRPGWNFDSAGWDAGLEVCFTHAG